jgi:hypothetical protein
MTMRYTTQQGKGRVAAVIGDALSEVGAEPLLTMSGPLAAIVAKAEAHSARVAPDREPKGCRYPTCWSASPRPAEGQAVRGRFGRHPTLASPAADRTGTPAAPAPEGRPGAA